MRWARPSLAALATLGLTTACGFDGGGLGGTSGDDGGLLDGTAMVVHGHPEGGNGFDATNPLDGGVLLPDCGVDKVLDGNTCVSCQDGSVPEDGGCVPCGNSGERCCAGNACNVPNMCGGGGMPMGTCGCTLSTSCCTGKQCGSCQNNCGTLTTCPSTCTGPQICRNDACCNPKNDCAGVCGDISDGCGGVLHCSSDCGNGNCCGGDNACHQNCDNGCWRHDSCGNLCICI